MIFLESQTEFPGISVVTFLTDRLEVHLVELALHRHLLVTGGAGEVVDAPGLVEGREDVALYDLVADLAEVAEQLVVVSLAVGQAFPLVVPVTQERFLTLGADKVLHTPVLPQGGDDPALYGSPAGATDGDAHLVVTPQAVQLVELLGRVARPGPHLPGGAGELGAAALAVEVVGTVVLAAEPERLAFYREFTCLTHVLPCSRGFHLSIALMAECSALVLDEAQVCQLLVTHLTAETLRVPGRSHRLDDSSDDELPTFGAAGSEENMEAMLAVFPILEVVENSIWKLSEALGAHKAANTEQLAVAVDNLGVWLEPVLAAGTGDTVEVHDTRHVPRWC